MFRNPDYVLNIPKLLASINTAGRSTKIDNIISQYESQYNSSARVKILLTGINNSNELTKLIESTNNPLELDEIISSEQFTKYQDETVLNATLHNLKIFSISWNNRKKLASLANNAIALYKISIKTRVWLSPFDTAFIFGENVSRLAEKATTAEELEYLIMLPPITSSVRLSEIGSNPFSAGFMQLRGMATLRQTIKPTHIKKVCNALLNNPNLKEVSKEYISKLKNLYYEEKQALESYLKLCANFTEDSNKECREELANINSKLEMLNMIIAEQKILDHDMHQILVNVLA